MTVLRRRRPQDRCEVLITFDDGFRNNAEVAAPILRQYRVPAVFFVCSRPAMAGKYLWFSYLWALERHFDRDGFFFRTEFFSMSLENRRQSLQRLRNGLLALTPHPSAMYEAIEDELPRLEEFISPGDLANCYAGMSAGQLAELAGDPLFSIGIHTVDHPLLTKCEPAEALRQVQGNRAWIEDTCGHTCDAIAYPGGDYDRQVLELCRVAGLSRGYCVSPSVHVTPHMEIPRLGIYSTSTDVLGLKAQWGSLMRSMHLPVG